MAVESIVQLYALLFGIATILAVGLLIYSAKQAK